MFYKDRDGLIGHHELKRILRHLGHNPTDAELQDLAYQMDAGTKIYEVQIYFSPTPLNFDIKSWFFTQNTIYFIQEN